MGVGDRVGLEPQVEVEVVVDRITDRHVGDIDHQFVHHGLDTVGADLQQRAVRARPQ
jgi:hypothetical protein